MRLPSSFKHRPRLLTLSTEQIKDIHEAALAILERTGVKVLHDRACRALQEAGAYVRDGTVYIPPFLVEMALDSAPSRVDLHNREGKLCFSLENNRPYFGGPSGKPNITDSTTLRERPLTTEDLVALVQIMNQLPNIDFVTGMPPGDVHPLVSDVFQFRTMLLHSTKPLYGPVIYASNLTHILDMCVTVIGSEEELQLRPFLAVTCTPISPLTYDTDVVEKLMVLAERGVVVVLVPYPVGGATGPVTLAGALAQSYAEALAGVVLCQLVRRGAPVIIGGGGSMMDMLTGILPAGSPECAVIATGMGQIARYYGLPSYCLGLRTDSKDIDAQAASEVMFSGLMAALNGGLILGAGGLGLTSCSHEMLVLCNDIIGMLKRFVSEIEVSDETLALEVIHAVGPGGNFIAEGHTLLHFREHWRPQLMDRHNYAEWVDKGSLTLEQRLKGEVQRILENHVPQTLPEEVEREVEKIAALAAQQVS